MAISERLQTYIREKGVDYQLIQHVPTGSSMLTAEAAHVPGDSIAKGVVVREDDSYLLVVVPADYVVELSTLHKLLDREVALASEEEFSGLFSDCEIGAVPPIGMAYGIKTVWDPKTSLGRLDEVYFEAGDHEQLVRVSGESFHELMAEAERGHFSHHL